MMLPFFRICVHLKIPDWILAPGWPCRQRRGSLRRVGCAGPQDASQHLVVTQRLVLFGGEAGPTLGGVGIRKAQNPEAVVWQRHLRLLGMEDRAGRRARLHLQKEKHWEQSSRRTETITIQLRLNHQNHQVGFRKGLGLESRQLSGYC